MNEHAPNPASAKVWQPFIGRDTAAAPFDVLLTACEQRGLLQDFSLELVEHMRSGFVYALPRLFVMAKAVLLDDGRTAWHVLHAHGDLRALMSVMPFPLDWIVFERRGDGRRREYRTERLIALATRQKAATRSTAVNAEPASASDARVVANSNTPT